MTMPRRRPGRPRRDDQRQTRELVLAVATRLFAERGFDGVGLREVAAAADVDVATVAHHTGTKAQLYDACFARVYDAEREVLERAARRAREAAGGSAAEALAGLHHLADVFVDFLEDRPETTRLWLRRWLEPGRHGGFDQRYAVPLYRLAEELLDTASAAGRLTEPAAHVVVRSLVWAVHGHVVALADVAPDQLAGRRAEFRAFVHRWLDALYGTRDVPPPG
ncbi:TetR/AcrR family transcriptional regulator [Micromonospora cathayae]|uniref:TetR/AcrR family transcriptional regulator n=1 Tax=Micromonospora cathayae TaxID=3028804 RepID=A0ABY7ZTS5_9ACTN|nr:TetR/AcrR family transcriptional regulator [Micromonospora sp. HUAS 3]WDZ86451.1 TetR/AcrR family transcriptional regulator [Micromonospora sp. HUAS 3]